MNVLLNNYCNLKCKYCFAQDEMSKGAKGITPEQLEERIEFYKKGNIKEFRIIGGEPTLHPDFVYILTRIANDPFFERIQIFSNMTFKREVLEAIILVSQIKKITITANINEEKIIGKEAYEKILFNIKHLSDRNSNIVTPGINIYSPDMDYSYIFDIANKYNLGHIRWSIVVPNEPIDENFDVKEYFRSFADLIVNFSRDAIKYKKTNRLDCNKIPPCAFTDEQLRRILYSNPNIFEKQTCGDGAPLDIDTHGQAIRCFGLSEYYSTDFKKYNSEKELFQNIELHTEKLKHIPLFDECVNCDIYKANNNVSCGCMAYKIHKLKE